MLPSVAAGALLAACAWQAPVPGPVSGPAVDGYRPAASPWGPGHRGLDLPARPGDPVLSPLGGSVTVAAVIAGRPVLVIAGPRAWRATLEPVAATVPVGAVVEAGQLVGRIGRGGHCDRRCLHLGARGEGRTYTDPAGLLRCRPVLKPDPPTPLA